MGIACTHLGRGHCIEVFYTGGDRDGALAGYVIKFAGGWNGWWLQPDGTLRLVYINGKTKDLAFEAIKRRS